MAQRVFLSYRRSDTAAQAVALKIVLERRLPDVTVFVDTESITPAEHWPNRLASALANSSAVVALIGRYWRFGPDGADRFQDPEDWVLREVVYGLEHMNGKFIPVIFDTTTKEAYRDLPASLVGIPAIQGQELAHGARWVQDADRLTSLLAKMLGTTKIGGAIAFPTPNEVKTQVPRVTEAEFDDHRLKMEGLKGWVFSHVPVITADGEIQGTEISRSFTFKNFKRAFTFMARVSKLAEDRPHHPDWTNVWNRVDVRLRTFDADHSVTWYDIEMACAMHDIALEVEKAAKVGWPLRVEGSTRRSK
jgi:4a-hydroxytetrahydrobiopterin dehydratase